jgi:riboflavin synthase
MFTGIIENTGIIEEITNNGTNKTFWLTSPFANELKVDQSLSHNGVCLTVEEIRGTMHRVTAIEETLLKTNLDKWVKGDTINLERCMPLNGRLDGHIVQGHVDSVAECIGLKAHQGSWEYQFSFDEKFSKLIIEKGSVCINGISLTAYNVSKNTFCVGIVPYTYNHTNIKDTAIGSKANIEFDMLGKYVVRFLEN